MTALTITALPDPPDRADPSTFAEKGDAFLGAFPTLVSEANALSADLTTKEASAVASAVTATAQAAAAAASAQAAASGSTAVVWVSGTTYALGDVRYSPIDFQSYRRIVAGAGTTDPSADATNWLLITGILMTRVARTSNTVLAASNRGNLIDVTSGTFTQTFGTASALGNNWFCWYRNSGTGAVTLTGLSIVLYPGETALLHSDGTTIRGQLLAGRQAISRSARTSNTILGLADRGTYIDITSGTFSQTLTAAATLGDGWYCVYRNSGTGVVTLDPNASETVDGVTTLALAIGETVIIQCDGANFNLVRLSGVGNHCVEVNTGNGFGSTNTKVRRFTTTVTNVGTAITYADSSTNGGSFTINEAGLYFMEWNDEAGAAAFFGFSLNMTGGTTAINSLAYAERLAMGAQANSTANRVTCLARLAAGDVIRAHGGATLPSGTTDLDKFVIRKVGR